MKTRILIITDKDEILVQTDSPHMIIVPDKFEARGRVFSPVSGGTWITFDEEGCSLQTILVTEVVE